MQEYDIRITETLKKSVTVKAAFCEESEEKVQQEYDNFEYTRNSENITEKWGEVDCRKK